MKSVTINLGLVKLDLKNGSSFAALVFVGLFGIVCSSLVFSQETKSNPNASSKESTKDATTNSKASEKQQSLPVIGKDLKDWKIPEERDFKNHGKVKLEKNQIFLSKGEPATGITWQKDTLKNNYEVSLEAQRTDGGDFFCGLTVPYKESHFTLIIGGWGGGVIGISSIDDYSAVENESTTYQEFKSNQWYAIKLRVTDEKIETWIDKKQMIDLETKDKKFSIWWEQDLVKPFGIATWKTSGVIRNLKVTAIDQTKSEKKKVTEPKPKK